MHNIQPSPGSLPAVNEDILVYFVTHCAWNLRISYTTIKSYLCGIRNLYIQNKYPNPLAESSGLPRLRLQLILRGIQKSRPKKPLSRLPITTNILKQFCHRLHAGFFGHYLDLLMQAACLLAFFAFLRCGEFTTCSQSFTPEMNLTLGDLTPIYHHGQITEMSLLIKVSKTDPFRQGCRVHVFRNNSILCPVQAMVHYLAIRRASCSTLCSPLFLLPDSLPLSRHKFLDMLSALCLNIGLDTRCYSGHSFRIGAATSAAAAHVPDHLIQSMGRWTSNCYKTYIQTPKTMFLEAQQCMVSIGVNKP
jgi:hypothetical protein